MRKFSAFLLIIICSFISINAQDIIRRCGNDEILKQDLLNNPSLSSTYLQQINNAVNNIVTYDTTLANTDSVYTIQVVVHIVYLGDNKYENIPDDIIQSQIDALNRDYNLLNEDTVNLRPFFKPFQGNTRIKFQLARTEPNGRATNGITRTKGQLGTLTGWSPLSNPLLYALNIEAVKSDFVLLTNSKGKSSWNVKKYMNIWVCDLNKENRKCNTCLTLCDTCGTLLGIATPPSNATNWGALAMEKGNNDGIIIDFRGFGQNNWFARDSASARFLAFYGKGRTPVHEVGHYLGLQHTWGNVLPLPGFDDGCAIDDFMDDTPEEEKAFANNLPRGFTNPCDTSVNTCNEIYLGRDYPDMFENYMDYSTDLCYNLFTKQQANIMRYNLLARRSGLIIKRELASSIPTAINNTKLKENGISIFPNPAKNSLNIFLGKPLKSAVTISIIDVSGKVILSQILPYNTTNQNLDISALANGMYMIQFSNEEFSAVEKFVKD